MLVYAKQSMFRARLLVYVLQSLTHSPDPNNPRLSAEAEILEKGVGTCGGVTAMTYIYICVCVCVCVDVYVDLILLELRMCLYIFKYIYIYVHVRIFKSPRIGSMSALCRRPCQASTPGSSPRSRAPAPRFGRGLRALGLEGLGSLG